MVKSRDCGYTLTEMTRSVEIRRATVYRIVSTLEKRGYLDRGQDNGNRWRKKQGYAIDNQENELDGRSIGAPVHGPDGRVLGALSISSPLFRMI